MTHRDGPLRNAQRGRPHRTKLKDRGPCLKIEIVHGGQVAHRDRLSLARHRLSRRRFPRGARILHLAAIISPRRPTRAYLPFRAAQLFWRCARACASAEPVASACRQRREMARQAWTSCCIATGDGRSGRPLRYDVVTGAPGSPAFDVSRRRRAGRAITDARNMLSGLFVRFRRESRAMGGTDLAEKWDLPLIDRNGRR